MDDRVLHDFLVESIPLWQQNPVQFFEEVLSFYPDEWQKEAAFALRDNPKVRSNLDRVLERQDLKLQHCCGF